MTEKSQLDIIQQICKNSEPDLTKGDYYLYVYLGKATKTDTQYQFVEELGRELESGWIFNHDPSDKSAVCYVGIGTKIRPYEDHSYISVPKECTLLILSGYSRTDLLNIERQCIAALGRITGKEQGCLTNRNGCGDLTAWPEYSIYKLQKGQGARMVYVLTHNKLVFDYGLSTEIAEKYSITANKLHLMCSGKTKTPIAGPSNEDLWICNEEDFDEFVPKHQLRQVYAVTLNADNEKQVVGSGTKAEIAKTLGINPTEIRRCLGLDSKTQSVALSKVLNQYLSFCFAEDFNSHIHKPKSIRKPDKRNQVIVAKHVLGPVLEGTASELSQLTGIRSGVFHTAISTTGKHKQWSLEYK